MKTFTTAFDLLTLLGTKIQVTGKNLKMPFLQPA